MRIGIHCSTAGSLERAALKALELEANALQIFSASPRMWRAKSPDPEQIRKLEEVRAESDLRPLVIHGSYLINLASPDVVIRQKSILGFRGELERALAIGAEYLVIHPGNYKGLTVEQGMLNIAEAVAVAWREVNPALQASPRLSVLLENTAGAGAQLGGKLEELATIRSLVQPYLDLPVGFCLDTCHCYVGGFDVSKRLGLDHFLLEASGTLGLKHVPVIHANDTKMKLASHCDRHANIGEGLIGLDGFKRIVNHVKLRDKAFILETPVDNPGDDLRNVRALKKLVFPEKPATGPKAARKKAVRQ